MSTTSALSITEMRSDITLRAEMRSDITLRAEMRSDITLRAEMRSDITLSRLSYVTFSVLRLMSEHQT